MEREGTVCGRRTIVMKENELAERVGFEPTCRLPRQDAFEAPPLQPLRYLSIIFPWQG